MNETKKVNIRELAMEAASGSPLMIGREKKHMEDWLNQKATISNIDFLNDSDGQPFVVFTTVEEPTKYTFGGMVLTDIMTKVINQSGLTLEEFNSVLEGEPLAVKFTRKLSKNNTRYTVVEVL